MDTLKIAGYMVSAAGLGVIALSKKVASLLSFLGAKANLVAIMAGLVLVIVGIALIMMKTSSSYSNIKHAEPEVPIYEGKGKNRKIVGYHRANE